jgi:hypothetical protein
MRRAITAVTLCLGSFLVPAVATGQNGVQQFSHDSLNASATSATHSIFVNGFINQNPFGMIQSAFVNIFDFVNFQFRQCSGSNVNVVVNSGQIALSFVVDSGFNCSMVGQTISAKCSTTQDSGFAHRVSSGTNFLSGERFNTQGTTSSYSNLICNLQGLESDIVANGSALTTREITTP